MVKRYTKTGGIFHEPPYTEEEQLEMYRRMSGVVSFTRRAPAAASPKRAPSENGDGGSDG
jgi:hypothetical protein